MSKIIMSADKQNLRFWATENPRVMHEKPLHPLEDTVWCGIHAEGGIGPYLFEDAIGNTVTVTGESYRAMINDFLGRACLVNMWCQQDGAIAHTA